MINKQSLWFLTLFSLILVLSVYYITMPTEILAPKDDIDGVVSIDEKNNAYEQLRLLDDIKGREEKIESKILEIFKMKSFVKILDNQIKIVISNSNHYVELANNIMREVQKDFPEKMYISVKFQG